MRRFTLRPFHSRWQANRPGYNLYVEDRKPFGHVKYNVAGAHAYHFTIYAYQYRPEDDPGGLFNADASPRQIHGHVRPDDEPRIRYFLRVLEASYRRRASM